MVVSPECGLAVVRCGEFVVCSWLVSWRCLRTDEPDEGLVNLEEEDSAEPRKVSSARGGWTDNDSGLLRQSAWLESSGGGVGSQVALLFSGPGLR